MQKQCEKKCLEKEQWSVLVDKSTDHDKPHFDLFFYHNINVKEMFFFRARAGKSIAWHIDESSMVWTLIYHGKLADQIAR